MGQSIGPDCGPAQGAGRKLLRRRIHVAAVNGAHILDPHRLWRLVFDLDAVAPSLVQGLEDLVHHINEHNFVAGARE